MRRRPRATKSTPSFPALSALATLVVGAGVTGCERPPPGNPPEPRNPPTSADARVPTHPPVIRIPSPDQIPPVMGGAIAPVSPQPPTPPPSAAPPSAMAPSAAAAPSVAAVGSAAAPAREVLVVHNHPPGTPCHPVSEHEVRAAFQRTP